MNVVGAYFFQHFGVDELLAVVVVVTAHVTVCAVYEVLWQGRRCLLGVRHWKVVHPGKEVKLY